MGVVAGIAIAGGIAAAVGATTNAIAANKAKKAMNAEERKAAEQNEILAALEADRPVFKNPYADMKNQFQDLDNPYANLTVATEAMKIQAQQADQALANSLDVMMETGQAAGGATALAQAALQSKRGIAASIQGQEVKNKSMAAEGQAQVALQKAQGAANLDVMRAKGNEMEQLDAIGFHEKKMDRVAGLADNAAQNAQDQRAARAAAITGIGTSVIQGASIAASGIKPK